MVGLFSKVVANTKVLRPMYCCVSAIPDKFLVQINKVIKVKASVMSYAMRIEDYRSSWGAVQGERFVEIVAWCKAMLFITSMCDIHVR